MYAHGSWPSLTFSDDFMSEQPRRQALVPATVERERMAG